MSLCAPYASISEANDKFLFSEFDEKKKKNKKGKKAKNAVISIVEVKVPEVPVATEVPVVAEVPEVPVVPVAAEVQVDSRVEVEQQSQLKEFQDQFLQELEGCRQQMEEQHQTPCRFYQFSMCTRENCRFLHILQNFSPLQSSQHHQQAQQPLMVQTRLPLQVQAQQPLLVQARSPLHVQQPLHRPQQPPPTQSARQWLEQIKPNLDPVWFGLLVLFLAKLQDETESVQAMLNTGSTTANMPLYMLATDELRSHLTEQEFRKDLIQLTRYYNPSAFLIFPSERQVVWEDQTWVHLAIKRNIPRLPNGRR